MPEPGRPPAFGLVLIGDEYLLGILRLRQHRSLFSRIACHWSLGLWAAPLVAQYVQPSLAHQLYQLTGQTLRLAFDRERMWYEMLRLLDDHKESRECYQESLRGVVAEQSAMNAKLVICLDNNTKVLEECRDELRCSRRRKAK